MSIQGKQKYDSDKDTMQKNRFMIEDRKKSKFPF
jgi:hypothetical protein